MIKLIIVFIIGLVLGSFCGIFLIALCYNSKASEEIYADVINKLEESKIEENNKNLNKVNEVNKINEVNK